jgi:hypothetical protein
VVSSSPERQQKDQRVKVPSGEFEDEAGNTAVRLAAHTLASLTTGAVSGVQQ